MKMLWRCHGRHRVEDFARGVDGGVDSCPEEPSTSRFVGIANALRAVPLRPSPELTLALRRRIVNAARAGHHDESRPLLAWLLDGIRVKRGLPSTTVLLTAAVALVSIGFGTTQALPGDTLYGLKLRGESIGIALAHSDEAKGYSDLRYAGARLRDVSGLIDHDGVWREATVTTADRDSSRHLAGLVNSTLTTMNGYTDKGATSLRRAYQRTHDPAPLAYLDDFTMKQHKTLSGMLGRLPAASQRVAGASLNLVDRLAREASKLLTEHCDDPLACQSEPPPSDNSASGTPPNATPSEDPATSRTSDITTGGSPDPDGAGTPPQQGPSTAEPPGATTPTGPGSSDGSHSGDGTQQTSPPSTGSGSTGSGGSGSGSSTGGSGTGSPSSQPSPPQPTGVPSTAPDTSAGSTSSGADATGGEAPATTSPSDTSGSNDSPSSPPESSSPSSPSGPSSPSSPSGPSSPSRSGPGTPAQPPSDPPGANTSEPPGGAKSDPSGRSGPLGGLRQLLTGQPSDSATTASPTP